MSRWSKARARWLGLVVIVVALLALAEGLKPRYRLGLDIQRQGCLPYRAFLLDLSPHPVTRGDYVVFRADDRLTVFFPAGWLVVKQVAGVPGDRVTVTAASITINGAPMPGTSPAYGALPLAPRLKQPVTTFYRDEPVPPGQLWVLGTAVNSFDSRYWGYLSDPQVLGRAYPLW